MASREYRRARYPGNEVSVWYRHKIVRRGDYTGETARWVIHVSSDREKSENNSVLGVGSRLASGPAAELVQTAFARELADQLALFRGMSLADMAHTVMLIEAGVIPLSEGAALLSALLALHEYPPDFNPTPKIRRSLYEP